MKVWVYPERVFEELGATSYEIEYEVLRPNAGLEHEIDFDGDIEYCHARFRTRQQALARARQVLDQGLPYFGSVRVTRQIVDWYVEERKIAEWMDTSDTEEVS